MKKEKLETSILCFFGPSAADDYPKPKRYHVKCGQQLVEVTREKMNKNV